MRTDWYSPYQASELAQGMIFYLFIYFWHQKIWGFFFFYVVTRFLDQKGTFLFRHFQRKDFYKINCSFSEHLLLVEEWQTLPASQVYSHMNHRCLYFKVSVDKLFSEHYKKQFINIRWRYEVITDCNSVEPGWKACSGFACIYPSYRASEHWFHIRHRVKCFGEFRDERDYNPFIFQSQSF